MPAYTETPKSTAASSESGLRPPPVHASGVTPLLECAGSKSRAESNWYQNPETPGFLVCSRCFVDHIYDSPFRDRFTRHHVPNDDTPRSCLFGSPRMTKKLWAETLSSGSLTGVTEFMQRRAELGICPEGEEVTGATWYVSDDMPGATFCRACYEDRIALTVFHHRFRQEVVPGSATCDFNTVYINRLLDAHGEEPDHWDFLAKEIMTRLQIPPCPKTQQVRADSRAWFISNQGSSTKPNLIVCAACYCDYFHDTPDQPSFSQATNLGDIQIDCALGGAFNLLMPAQQAIAKSNRQIFWRAVSAVTQNPRCSPSGTHGATWYTLPSMPAAFSICGACFGALVGTMGGTELFVPDPRIGTVLCAFSPGHARFLEILDRYVRTLLTGDVKILDDFLQVFAAVPRCPRSNRKAGANCRWWGWADARICEDCYLTMPAKGTRLEASFALRGERDPDAERMCHVYSARMRQLYAEACAQPDGAAAFVAAGGHRLRVYIDTVMVADRIRQQQTLAVLRAAQLRNSSMSNTFMGYSQANAMGSSYTVGNAYAGYGFENDLLLQGAVDQKRAAEVSAEATNPAHGMNVATLMARWREVE